MTPDVFRIVSDHRNLEEQIERQMGCMTGFLQLFDRHQILAGKQFYSTKRLLSSSTAESLSPSERSEMSAMSLVKEAPLSPSSPSPQGCPSSPENSVPTKSPRRHTLPLPVFELKDGLKTSWKLREAPRLSLDSRASVDAKGTLRPREIQTTPGLLFRNPSEFSEKGDYQEKRRRSPSVVARLMGLEVLPAASSGEPPKRAELRRSSSESRVARGMSQFNLQEPSPMTSEEVFRPCYEYSEMMPRNTKSESPRPPLVSIHRKSFFDSQEFFPDPKRVGSLYGEIEKRLRMRGIEEPAKDLETLKQILEALQLKGLLHSKPPEREDGIRRNVVHSRRPRTSSASSQSPIVIMKPAPKPPPRLAGSLHRIPPPRSISPHLPQAQETILPPSRALRDQNLQSLARQIPRSLEPSSTSRTPSLSPVRRRPLSAEGQRAPLPQRRIPAVNAPKPSPKKRGSSPAGSPKNRTPTIGIPPKDNIYSPVSDSSSIGSPSQFDFERPPEYTSGRSLLARCDKLLHSIAAITSSADPVNPTDRQPSPVSVLDSTFLSDDHLASPLPKRGINLNDQLTDWDEEHWNNQPSSTAGSNSYSGDQAPETTDNKGEDYAYVADVVRESNLNRTAGAFATIENRHHSAASSPLHRRLLFDTVTELVDRKRQLAPWDAFCRSFTAGDGNSLLREVWEELRRIQEHVGAEDAMEVTRAVIRKDMAAPVDGEQGWGLSGSEMSCAVLHIERQVFKDLVADTIKELADIAGRCRRTTALSRRKLFF